MHERPIFFDARLRHFVGYSFRLDGFLQRDRVAMRSREAAPKLDLVTK
jgi:hypothetical protein